MDIEEFMKKVLEACKRLSLNDKLLFELGHHEETLNHRLALYLTGLFFNYDVDVEYSLSERDLKTNKDGVPVRPDIIIHRRGNNNNNLAVFEAKRSSNTSVADIPKIPKYSNLGYRYGVFIKYTKEGNLDVKRSMLYIFEDSTWYDFNL